MSGWDLHDWIGEAIEHGRVEKCPSCGSGNIKIAIHSFKVRGFNFSACCHDCKHEESGVNKDLHSFVSNWFK